MPVPTSLQDIYCPELGETSAYYPLVPKAGGGYGPSFPPATINLIIRAIGLLLSDINGNGHRVHNVSQVLATDTIGVRTVNPLSPVHALASAPGWGAASYGIGVNYYAGPNASSSAHPAYGITDFQGLNPWALVNSGGDIIFYAMPGDPNVSSGNPVPILRLKQNGHIKIVNTPVYGTLSAALADTTLESNELFKITGSYGLNAR